MLGIHLIPTRPKMIEVVAKGGCKYPPYSQTLMPLIAVTVVIVTPVVMSLPIREAAHLSVPVTILYQPLMPRSAIRYFKNMKQKQYYY